MREDNNNNKKEVQDRQGKVSSDLTWEPDGLHFSSGSVGDQLCVWPQCHWALGSSSISEKFRSTLS